MVRGSCFCGGIQFEADEVGLLNHCHCSTCRKLSGAAFVTYAHVEKAKFRFIRGAELISRYPSAPGQHREFCRVCGSMAPGDMPHLPTVSIPAGLLDDDPKIRPALHVFVASKVAWWEIADNLPKFDKWVPGYKPEWAGSGQASA
jgi:hypothetical protein